MRNLERFVRAPTFDLSLFLCVGARSGQALGAQRPIRRPRVSEPDGPVRVRRDRGAAPREHRPPGQGRSQVEPSGRGHRGHGGQRVPGGLQQGDGDPRPRGRLGSQGLSHTHTHKRRITHWEAKTSTSRLVPRASCDCTESVFRRNMQDRMHIDHSRHLPLATSLCRSSMPAPPSTPRASWWPTAAACST